MSLSMPSSSKDKLSKFDEPVKLDTTVLKINVKTNGDVTTKDYDLIPFHPNMSDIKDLSNNNYIFFPTFSKITMMDLKRAKVGTNYSKVFTSLERYLKLIKYIASDQRETDNTLLVDQSKAKQYALSILEDITGDVVNDFVSVQKEENSDEGLTEEEIITNNIGLIKQIFFPTKGRFYIFGREYIIGKSKYLPKYETSGEVNKFLEEKRKIPLTYTIEIELELLDATNNPNAGDFSRLSCKAKKQNIKKDLDELFGTKFKTDETTKKAVISSLLQLPPEIRERGYGKLQKEWEERNKYIPQPKSEAERIEQEKKWTPLQKNMAAYDKIQKENSAIPKGWIKERSDLDEKYKNFEKEIKGYIEKIKKIETITGSSSFNDTMIQTEKDKIQNATTILVAPLKEALSDEKNKNKVENEKNRTAIDEAIQNLLKNRNSTLFITTIRKMEEDLIDTKYVQPFVEELENVEKDITVLEQEQIELDEKKGNAIYKKAELEKIQTKLFNKKVKKEQLIKKYGPKGSLLIAKWKSGLDKINGIKSLIKSEKTLEETKIASQTVNTELEQKLKEITEAKKILLLASFVAGEDKELTKSEKEDFGKKPPPAETYDYLLTKIKNLEDSYLEIASK